MSNPRLPTELKRMKGTLNVTREKENPASDVLIAKTGVIMAEDEKVSVPKSLTDRNVKKFWKETVKNLLTLRVLSRVDLQQVETMCITLQKLREVQLEFSQMSIEDEKFDLIQRRFLQLSKRFDELAGKFYISPQARTQLKLNDLNLVKTAQEIQKNDNAITALLNAREN